MSQNDDWNDTVIIVQWFSKIKSGSNETKYILKDWYGKVSHQSVIATGIQMKTVWKYSSDVKHLIVDHYRVITPVAAITQIIHGRFQKIASPFPLSIISSSKIAKMKANRFLCSISDIDDVNYIKQRYMELC
jgi:hypothetical protein